MSNPHTRSEEYLHLLFWESDEAVLVMEPGVGILEANPAAATLLGYEANQLRGMRYAEILAEGEPERRPWADSADKSTVLLEHEFRRQDGSTFPCAIKARRLSNGNQMVLFRDLTAEREAAELARESEERMRLVFDEAHDPTFIAVPGLGIIDLNPALSQLLGYAPEELVGKSYETLLAPGDLERTPWQESVVEAGRPADVERTFRRKDGTTFTAQTRARRLSNGTRMITVRDLTPELEAEAASAVAAEQQSRLGVLFEEAADAILVVTPPQPDTRILEFNAEAAKLLRYSPERLRGTPYNDVLAPGEEHPASLTLDRLDPGDIVERDRILICGDGTRISVHVRAKLLSDGNIMVVIRDLTVIRATQQALKDSDDRLRILFNEGTEGILVGPLHGTFLAANPAASMILGYSETELKERGFADLLVSGELDRQPTPVADLRAGMHISIERRMVRKDGTEILVSIRSKMLSDQTVMASLRDITAERAAEVASRERDERLRMLFEDGADPVFVFNADATAILEYNRAALDFFGYHADELRKMSYKDMITEESLAARPLRSPEARLQGTHKATREMTKKDGSVVLAEVLAQPIGEDLIMLVLRDVTERERAETELRQSEARLEQAQQLARVVSWEWDCVADVLSSARGAARILGVDPPPVANLGDFLAMVHRDDQERVRQAYFHSRDTGETLALEHRIVRPGGVIRHVQEWATVEQDESGRALRFSGASQDVTELRGTVQALRRSEEHLRSLIREAPVSLLEFDGNGVVTAAGGQSIGRPSLVGLDMREAFEDQPVFVALLEAAYRGEAADGPIPMHPKSTVHASLRPTIGDDGKVARILVVLVDVTEQTKLQEELHQSRRLEAIGQLAGGIAHDFNNLLTVINGNSELSLEALGGDEPVSSYLSDIHLAGLRAADLTEQLLAFSRNQPVATAQISLNETVVDMVRLLGRLIGPSIELVTELGDAVPLIEADPGQVEQVLVNLAVNARDAMADGGRLTIATKAALTARGRPAAELRVADDGTGMDASVQSHIFEPFYTTKELGKGTGLGLSTVYGIVQQAGGSVTVDSAPTGGTTFVVTFPGVPSPD